MFKNKVAFFVALCSALERFDLNAAVEAKDEGALKAWVDGKLNEVKAGADVAIGKAKSELEPAQTRIAELEGEKAAAKQACEEGRMM